MQPASGNDFEKKKLKNLMIFYGINFTYFTLFLFFKYKLSILDNLVLILKSKFFKFKLSDLAFFLNRK